MTEPFLGQIQPFGFNFAPRDWARCDGQLLQISQNTALFSLLGTRFGGDGKTTFALPDLRGRASLHQGTGPGLEPRFMGERGGSETQTLSVGSLPSHTHAANLLARAEDATLPKPENNLLAAGAPIYASGVQDTTMSNQAIAATNTGGGAAHNNLQPYIVVNWCIALFGIFPPRN